MGRNTPYVVKVEIMLLNAISVLVDQGFTIEEVISELGIDKDFADHFELIKTYKVKEDRFTKLYNAEDRSQEEQEELEQLMEDQE
jgi:phosphotransacetylase